MRNKNKFVGSTLGTIWDDRESADEVTNVYVMCSFCILFSLTLYAAGAAGPIAESLEDWTATFKVLRLFDAATS